MVFNYAAIAAVSPIPFKPLGQDEIDRFDVFALGDQQHMQHITHSNQHLPTGFSSWDTMGTKSFLSPPSAVALEKNKIEVFALGTDSHMYWYSWSGGSWSDDNNWKDLGGHDFQSQPCTVGLGTKHWFVFALDGSNQVAYMEGNGGTPSSWKTLSSTSSLTPSFVSPPVALALRENKQTQENQQMEVFVLGKNGQVYRRSWQQPTGWSPAWEDLGGPLVCPPCAVVRDDQKGAFELFGLKADRHIYQKSWDGQQWLTDWNGPLSGVMDSSPSGVSLGPDHYITTVLQKVPGEPNAPAQVGHAVMSGTFALPHSSTATPTAWELMGYVFPGTSIQFVSPPCTLGRSTFRLDVFILGSDYHMYYHTWDGILWQPKQHTWLPLGGQFLIPEVMGSRLFSGVASS